MATLIAAAAAFIGTNIDDLFLNMLFFAQTETRRERHAVIAGKYLGIGFLLLVSCLGAGLLASFTAEHGRWLGLVPAAMGVCACVNGRGKEEQTGETGPSKGLALSMALVTVANGGDNLGVYIPLFAGYSFAQLTAVWIVFAVMTALWCAAGLKLAEMPVLRGLLLKYKHTLVPVVLIGIGLYILLG